MAQPYLVAMNHNEWQAKNVLKKFNRNRPLGEIEFQHRYKPAQPVLSCRTVEIDSTGTRTYRARNNIEIIEEQHRLIHEIYTKARNISSAPPGGQRTKPKVLNQDQVRALQGLRVSGNNIGAPQSRVDSGKTEFIILRTRPNTTGSHKRRAHAAIDTELKLEINPEIDSSAEACNSTRQQIHSIWDPEQRSLDEGKFVRGRKDQPSVASTLDPRANSNWLSFGGGLQEKSSGVVDAFTAMKHEGQFYTIDGGTGIAVARQLHRGDKIRIGINGQQPPPDYRIKEYQQNMRDDASSTSNTSHHHQIVPLCWTDQVQREDTIIVKSSTPKDHTPKKNLNETHPVVFKRFGIDGSRPPPSPAKERTSRKANVRVVEGYGVKRRTSARTNIDGTREKPQSRVTHISVHRKDDEPNDLSYEDVLDMRIKSRTTTGPLIHEQLQTAGEQLDHTATNGHEYKSNDVTLKVKSRVRPMSTISSSGSPDFGGYIIGGLPQQNGRQVTSPVHSDAPGSGRPAGRKKSARPPPLKPNLHKTTAASGISIGSGRSDKHTQYINMTQQLCITKEHAPKQENTTKDRASPGGNFAAIRSVSEHNRPKDKDVKFKEQMEEIIPSNFERKHPIDTVPDFIRKPDISKSLPEPEIDVHENDNDEKSSVDSLGSDKKYAFNIPTADHELETERTESVRKPEIRVAKMVEQKQTGSDVEQ